MFVTRQHTVFLRECAPATMPRRSVLSGWKNMDNICRRNFHSKSDAKWSPSARRKRIHTRKKLLADFYKHTPANNVHAHTHTSGRETRQAWQISRTLTWTWKAPLLQRRSSGKSWRGLKDAQARWTTAKNFIDSLPNSHLPNRPGLGINCKKKRRSATNVQNYRSPVPEHCPEVTGSYLPPRLSLITRVHGCIWAAFHRSTTNHKSPTTTRARSGRQLLRVLFSNFVIPFPGRVPFLDCPQTPSPRRVIHSINGKKPRNWLLAQLRWQYLR